MPREIATDELEHEGTTYEIQYQVIIECEHCSYQWNTASAADRPTCPGCHRKTDRQTVGGYYEDITRDSLFDFDSDAEVTGNDVVAAFRERAAKYEAMLANGWRLLNTGGQASVWLAKGDVELDPPAE